MSETEERSYAGIDQEKEEAGAVEKGREVEAIGSTA